MYVESSIYVNKAFQAGLCYFDHSYSAFNKVTMRIDVMDVKFHPIRTGDVIKIMVGEKNSKLHYIKLK